MRFMKSIKRKVGNAILPVVGTILGLTILAGSVVGVALNSSKIVYRQNNLENQNDARQILYLACKYFCVEINNGKTPAEIRAELQEIFGPGLKITQDESDDGKFYIWYPNKYKVGNEYTTDDNVQEWLKATIRKTEGADDDGDHGDTGINNTLFSKEAKLDEKFAIGNMMTVYMTDEELLPGRRYALNEISLVESDIDTFDEAFTYMNNTGVLQIDDIGIALYQYGLVSGSGAVAKYVETPESATQPYTIVYKTGNLGGNYYWQSNGSDTTTWLYRQEYDIELLYKMICYYDNTMANRITSSDIKYAYDETDDSHTISCTKTGVNFGTDYTYSSTQRFAEALADYIFWDNLPRLVMHISEAEEKIYDLSDARVCDKYGYDGVVYSTSYANYVRYYGYIYVYKHEYEWNDAGLRVYVYYKDSRNISTNSAWYTEIDFTKEQIENMFKNNLTGYKDVNGNLDYNKIYEKLSNKYSSTIIQQAYQQYYDQMYTYYISDQNHLNETINGTISSSNVSKELSYWRNWTAEVNEKNNGNVDLRNFHYNTVKEFETWAEGYSNNSYYGGYSHQSTYDDYSYFLDNSGYLNPNFYKCNDTEQSKINYSVGVGNNTLTQMLLDYLNQRFKEKYIDTNTPVMSSGGSSTLNSGESFGEIVVDDSGQLIYAPELNLVTKNGQKMYKLSYHFNVLVKKEEGSFTKKVKKGIFGLGGTTTYTVYKKYRYELRNWYSDDTSNGTSGDSDTLYFTISEFFNLFGSALLEKYANDHLSQETIETIEHIDTEQLTREYLKEQMVDPIRYQYMPISTYTEILGNNTKTGLKQQSITNKLIAYYLENADDDLKDDIDNAEYTLNIKSVKYENDLSGSLKDMFDYIVEFEIKVYVDGSLVKTITRKVSFVIQFMTYSSQNNAIYDATTNTYTDTYNTNVTRLLDTDGEYKNFFDARIIQDNKGNKLDTDNLTDNDARTILTAIPYTERINSDQVKYGDHKITINGADYTVTKSYSDLYHVTQNTLYDGDIEDFPSNKDIVVDAGISLFVNGNLFLTGDQDITLGKNAMLFVNGNLDIRYSVTEEMNKSSNSTTYNTTWYARQLTADNIANFRKSGVDINAGANAKIIINGNFDYRGYKAKYAKSSSKNIRIQNDPSNTLLDTVYEQAVLNTGFKSGNECTLDESTGRWTHYGNECRSALEGVYIVNGDVRFHAWDVKNTTDAGWNQWIAMYRNMYSNPIVKATFYVDGTFDMRGLYTSGLYDHCRANFVFAKSIIEPYIALNTLLCAEDPNYAAWSDTDGYLFMICEEAIDFSKVNFACINLFTPFQELVNAINENKVSETNFSEFIEKGAFTAMYPNKAVIDEWGLPSILRSGLGQLYSPGDIGAITPEDHLYGREV